MKFLFFLLWLSPLLLSAQNDRGAERGFVALTTFKILVEDKLTLFNDILRQDEGSGRMYGTYLDVQNEYGKMNLAYSVFRERLVNCVRNNEHRKKALECIGSRALNIDSLSNEFILKIDAALSRETGAGMIRKNISTVNPLTAKTAIEMVDYVYSIISRTRENRQKQLDILQAELQSERYELKPFTSLVQYRKGRR